ncbi:hypothetical protein HID58_081665 [Brassica napus]|uniref:Uncharacterized protein n=1 Tax=Brassica napus TaxID=3708 RepID=A0ABQ7Y8H5_BRANA|nr:hypothetical protein HID58_081665 [Brassica napus]
MRARVSSRILNRGSGCENGGENDGDNSGEITSEDFLYVCLDLNKNNTKPRWFTLSKIPKQQKLIPISLTHYKVHNSSSVFSVGSAIYMIGGFQKSKRIRNVSILECGTHQCRRLPKLRVPRRTPEVYTDICSPR